MTGSRPLESNRHLDVLAENALEHALGVPKDLVQIYRPWLHQLLLAEGKQLPRQVCRTLCRLANGPSIVDEGLGSIQFGKVLDQRLGLTEDDGQNVVEVVRDPAGQPADGVHLL